MMIALVGGLVVGLGIHAYLKQHDSSRNEATWNVINKHFCSRISPLQIRDCHSIGLFYIIGQLFMRGLQMAIVPLVLATP